MTNPPEDMASMTVEELQTKYLEVVGRSTGSDDRRYLIWKIREAEKGRINVGPRKTRAPDGEIPSAVILRDSFGEGLLPTLALHFQRATWIWTYDFPAQAIAAEKPAVDEEGSGLTAH